jgi:uncharacterized protein (DUF934 family)
MPKLQHAQIIKGREVVADDWSVLRLDEGETPEASRSRPASHRAAEGLAGAARDPARAPATSASGSPPTSGPDSSRTTSTSLAVIAVDFPKFSDGRGYSIAFNLRKRLGYTGELRAIGDVLRDQLFQMQRCGFDAYATRQDRSIDDALKGLTVFSETYQASVDQPLPLFRRHQRDVPLEHSDVGAGI